MTTATAAPVTAALTLLYEELAAEIPDVLTESFTFAALWADLARIAGETVPPALVLALDDPIALVPPVPVRRGSYAAHRREFPEACAD